MMANPVWLSLVSSSSLSKFTPTENGLVKVTRVFEAPGVPAGYFQARPQILSPMAVTKAVVAVPGETCRPGMVRKSALQESPNRDEDAAVVGETANPAVSA